MGDRIVWIYIAGTATASGAVIAATLILPRRLQSLAFVASILTLSTLAYNIQSALALSPIVSTYGYAGLISLVGFLSGYVLASAMILALAALPYPRSAKVKSVGSATARAAVILTALAEPTRYSPLQTTRSVTGGSGPDAGSIGLTMLPYMLLVQRMRYEAVGGSSPTVPALRQLAEAVSNHPARPVGTSVSYAARGAVGRIAALHRADDGDPLIIDLDGFVHGVTEESRAAEPHVRMLDPERVADILVEAATAAILELAPSQAGVVLCSVLDDRGESSAVSDREQLVSERVAQGLTEAGVSEDRIRFARLRDAGDGVTDAVRHFATRGFTEILVYAPAHPLGSLATAYDLVLAVKRARLDGNVHATTLKPDQVVERLANAVAKRLRG